MTDEMIDEDSSDDSSLIMEELARYRATVGGTIDAELLPPGYTPLNYAPYPNPLHLTICPPMNGLNISPVYYTSAPVAPHEYVIDDSNVANYEEVTTQAYSYPPPQATISLYSEIQRARAPTVSDDEEYPLAAVLQLPDYSANEYIPPPFRAPVLPMSVSTNAANNNNLSAEMTNAPPQPQPINNPSAPINNPSAPIDNPSAPINSHPFVSVNNPSVPTAPSQQATQIHAASQDESIQSAKKRGRKRLCDNAGGSKDGNMASDDVTPKKRGRKRKDGVDCADGKTNDSYENADNQSMDDANMEHISGDLDEAESD
ncbi:unnamed protein product [Litomosoides sigmodontis]|uniref:Uncharacterized protein n=1 Tax=Litomosoides sigmodontis TaxID=42156 RepID=A0A3P6T9W7_LITSI|nr:unnamed protein product [Litomosoides sigmodontis]